MTNIIFSDIDGCLIGKEPVCFTKITAELKTITASFIVILTTGKTAHEIIRLNNMLHLPGPFIVENGHGVLFKRSSAPIATFGKWVPLGNYCLLPLGDIKPDLSILRSLCQPHCLLTEMEDNYLASLTGMSEEDASLAKQRFFTESIYISRLTPMALKILKKQLAQKKLYYSQTYRFLHVTKCFSNKGRAIKFLLQSLFSATVNNTYAIGDSLNDFSMFAHCDKSYYLCNQPYVRLPKNCEVIMEKELSGWINALKRIKMDRETH